MSSTKDRSWLERIGRRDFLEGVLLLASGVSCHEALTPVPSATPPENDTTPSQPPVPSSTSNLNPKILGAGESFTIGHALRDAQSFPEGTVESSPHEVLVIGGGLSGLAAAWALSRYGIKDTKVIEKERRAGGHARSTTLEGRLAGVGSAYSLAPWNDLLTEFYRDLQVIRPKEKIPEKEYTVEEPVNRVFLGGRWNDDGWGEGMKTLPLEASVRSSLLELRARLQGFNEYKGSDGRAGFDAPVDDSTQDTKIRELDKVTFAAWAQSEKFAQGAANFFDPYCRSALGLGVNEISAWAAINFLQSEWGPILTQPGGNSYLAERLTNKIGAAGILAGRFVVRMTERNGIVRVTSVSEEGKDPRTHLARKVICAIPKFIARRLVSGLPERSDNAFRSFRYGPVIVANLALSSLDPGLHFDNWIHRSPGDDPALHLVSDILVPDYKERRGAAGQGILTAYASILPPYTRTQVLSDSFDVWATRILESLSVALPDVRERLIAMEIFRWGHPFVLARPGFIFGADRLLAQKPVGSIHFAHGDLDGTPSLEGAISQGVRAAQEVARALGYRKQSL